MPVPLCVETRLAMMDCGNGRPVAGLTGGGIGMFSRSCSLVTRDCGFWVAIWLLVRVFGLTEKVGEVWKLPLSDTSRFWAIGWAEKPSSLALVRSTARNK